jgi:hypothetical protein
MKRTVSLAIAFCLLMVSGVVAGQDDQKPELAAKHSSVQPADTVQPIELAIDDGSFEDAIGLTFGGQLYAINRLTPPRYPAILKQVKIFFRQEQFGGVAVGDPIFILTAPHENGSDDLTLTNFQTQSATVLALGQFVTYTVPDITINSGDFLVGFKITHPAGQFPIALDGTAPLNHRSYVSFNAVTFPHIEDANLRLVGNFGIRAEVNLVQTCTYSLAPASQGLRHRRWPRQL